MKTKPKAAEPPTTRSRKITIRITPEDYEQLAELRLALRLGTDSDALRSLIRLSHRHFRRAITRARREEGHTDRVAALRDRRQIEMEWS